MNGSYTDSEGKVYIRKMQDSLSLMEGDDQQLQLTNVTLEDSGWYTCLVSNQFDKVVSTGFVEVSQEQGQEVEEGRKEEGPHLIWLLAVSGDGGSCLLISPPRHCSPSC